MRNPFGSNTTLLKDKKKNTNNTVLTEPTTVVSENSAPHGQPGHVHQSGDDWGMEDDDDLFGTDIMNMDPHSQEFLDAMAAEMEGPTPHLGGELDENNWSDDFGDKGQTSIPQDDPDEPPEPGEPGHLEWYEERDGIKRPDGIKIPDGIKRTGGGIRAGGYGKKRVGEQSRKQMNLTASRRSSLLTGRV